MSKNNKDKQLKDAINNLLPDEAPEPVCMPLNCTAFSMQCYENNKYNNFRVMTLTIENGKVVDVKYSDPYASFEFIDRFENLSRPALYKLNAEWKDGKCLTSP